MGSRSSAQAPALVSRAQIVAEARAWIGTPYRHQASLKRAGCDCLGLVRGVWREVYRVEPEQPQPYTPDWAEETGEETLRDAARRHMHEIDAMPFRTGAPMPLGCLILIRMKERGPAKHAAIVTGPHRIVHAYSSHAVAENDLPDAWARRIAHAFDFPALTD